VFSSLRVRLPLLFLAGIVLAGIVTTAIAIQLFRDYSRNQTLRELRREASGIAICDGSTPAGGLASGGA